MVLGGRRLRLRRPIRRRRRGIDLGGRFGLGKRHPVRTQPLELLSLLLDLILLDRQLATHRDVQGFFHAYTLGETLLLALCLFERRRAYFKAARGKSE